jgi:hypothetical protein
MINPLKIIKFVCTFSLFGLVNPLLLMFLQYIHLLTISEWALFIWPTSIIAAGGSNLPEINQIQLILISLALNVSIYMVFGLLVYFFYGLIKSLQN